MNEQIIRSLAYNKKLFDYRDIFLVDENGNPDSELQKRFKTASLWEDYQVDDTRNLFKDIDYNNMTSANIDKIQAIAEKVVEKVQRAVKIYNPVPLMFDVKSGQLGKTIEAHEINGGRVYNYAYGGYRNESTIKHSTYTVVTTPKAVHFSIPLEQLKSGRYTTADLVFAATQAILRDKVGLAYTTFVSAYPTSGSHTTNNGGSSLSATSLNAAIDDIADTDSNSITVVGRHSALTPINDFNNSSTWNSFSDSALEEIRKRGYLTTYRGADIVRLSYISDEVYGSEPFGTSSVFAIATDRKFNRYVEVTKVQRRAWVSNADGNFHMIFEYEDGAAIWQKRYGHRIYSIG